MRCPPSFCLSPAGMGSWTPIPSLHGALGFPFSTFSSPNNFHCPLLTAGGLGVGEGVGRVRASFCVPEGASRVGRGGGSPDPMLAALCALDRHSKLASLLPTLHEGMEPISAWSGNPWGSASTVGWSSRNSLLWKEGLNPPSLARHGLLHVEEEGCMCTCVPQV